MDINQKQAGLLGWIIGLAYLFGCLSKARYLLDGAFLPNLGVFVILALGLVLWLWRYSVRYMGLSTLFWLMLALLVMLQPWLAVIHYPDTLIFPAAASLMCTLIGMTVLTLSESEKGFFLTVLLRFVLLAGLLTVGIQYLQLFQGQIGVLPGIMPLPDQAQPYGNVGQRNEASYIAACALVALMYFGSQCSAPMGKRGYVYQLGLFAGVVLIASGIGMSGSRVGVILGLAAMGFWVLKQNTVANKFKYLMVWGGLCLSGFLVGVLALRRFSAADGAIYRLVHGETNTRISLLQQATDMFFTRPWFGYGWGNFSGGGLERAEYLSWFAFSQHAHMVFSQIASELGVAGLLLLILLLLVVIRAVRLNLSVEKAAALTVVLVGIVYSLTEYPMWYMRYLVIFAAMMALIDKPLDTTVKLGRVMALPLSVVIGLSVFYGYVFWQAKTMNELLNDPESTQQAKVAMYQNMPKPFGMSDYAELFLFAIMPNSTDNIDEKIALGYRVAGRFTSDQVIRKQAIYLALDGKTDKALNLFKAACIINYAQTCTATSNSLEDLSSRYPTYFKEINTRYRQWLVVK